MVLELEPRLMQSATFEENSDLERVGLAEDKRPSPSSEILSLFIQEEGKPNQLHKDWAIFNLAIIPTGDGDIYIFRAVHAPSIQEGVPDTNVLVVCRRRAGGSLERLEDLDLPTGTGDGEIFNWEDPRVWMRDGARAILGLTAVASGVEDGKVFFKPHPALVEVTIGKGRLEVENVQVFKNIGKNIVPLGDKLIYHPELNTHSLHLLAKPESSKLETIKEIDFSSYSNIEWLRKKVGAVARPIRVGENLNLLPIHGVHEGIGLDGTEKDDIYAVGFALVDDDFAVLAVSGKPVWTRKDFIVNLPLSGDLRKEKKEVVYLDDWQETGGMYRFPINVGDRVTVVTEASISFLTSRDWVTSDLESGQYKDFRLPQPALAA